jgi:MoaA/NifB/PqqE/SkfB family radical SAM enzyme
MLECVPVASARLLWARSAGCRGSSVLNYRPPAAGKMGARRVDGIARRLVPAICDVSVTNVCNATCDFCAYAHDKGVVRDRRWVDRARLAEALPILHRCGVRYVNFQGGEPLLHPAIDGLIADVRANGMQPALITNGWLLPDKIERLAAAGLATLLVSLDSHSMAAHEHNRGLRGVGERIRKGVAVAHRHGITAISVVTVNHLVDYEQLPALLEDLGFDAVSFSYPRKEPFGSSSLVYGSESKLVDFTPDQLLAALDAIKALKSKFPVMNPTASLDDIKRYVRGEEQLIACVGGHKYFYLDWNLQIWRCEAWHEPLGSVFDLDRIADRRDRCTACIQNCYRDTSALMHAGVAVGDALVEASAGRIGKAMAQLFQRSVAQSLRSVVEEAGIIRQLARRPS